jgi:hypothetical protein
MSDRTDLELPETMHIEEVHEDPPAGVRPLSAREITMAAIAKKAEEQRERELAQAAIYDEDARNAGLSYPSDDEDASTPPVVETKPAAVLPAKATAPVENVTPAAAPMRAVTIDGQQWAVTEEQYAQLANLGMVTRHALLNQPQAQPAYVAPVPYPVVDRHRVEDTVEKMQYGDKATATEALHSLIADVVRSVPSAPQIDQDAIVRAAVHRAQEESKLAADRAVIQQEYSEVFADPQRTLLAKLNVDAIRQRNAREGRYQDDLDIYREAGNAVLDALGRPRPGSQTDQSSAIQAASVNVQPRQDVIERKRAAPRTTQVIDRRAVAPETPRPPTGSEIVERMRQSRGQASMR